MLYYTEIQFEDILTSTAALFWKIFMQNELKIHAYLGILFNFRVLIGQIGVVHLSGYHDA